ATAEGVRAPRLSKGPGRRRAARDSRALRQGQGERGQPGAEAGELGPPLSRVGEGVRAQAPALDGRLVAGVALARVDDVRRRLPLYRAFGHGFRGREGTDRTRLGRRN